MLRVFFFSQNFTKILVRNVLTQNLIEFYTTPFWFLRTLNRHYSFFLASLLLFRRWITFVKVLHTFISETLFTFSKWFFSFLFLGSVFCCLCFLDFATRKLKQVHARLTKDAFVIRAKKKSERFAITSPTLSSSRCKLISHRLPSPDTLIPLYISEFRECEVMFWLCVCGFYRLWSG